MNLHTSQRLGPYQIVAPIGRGGMGEVYRARDDRLNRDVAIKVLPPEFLADPDRLGRFEREAQAAAALNHPNILSVFDIGSDEGVPYFVCELLSGETLRERLDRGPLTVREVIDYGTQIARGIAVAHDAGIIHRDLKPENLFVMTDGRLKILDFGVAKATADEARPYERNLPTARATGTGVLVGTVPYMSPEQVRGAPADHRSDIFALGAVLYEMIVGRPAFAAPTAAETVSAILTRDPLNEAKDAKTPSALFEITRHCLEKDPARRFQSARDIAFGLEVLATERNDQAAGHRTATRRRVMMLVGVGVLALAAAAWLWTAWPLYPPSDSIGASERSIAALPFINLGGAAEDEYFSDGMTDSLITDLAKVDSLVVLARSAVFRYKSKNVDAQQVGRELGARYVLQGSVQRAGSRVRVNAQLVDAASGYHVWADRFDEDVKDLFTLQDTISTEIVSALKVTLSPRVSGTADRRPTTNPRAYEAYLQGLYYRHKGDQNSVNQAIPFFEQAAMEDPKFALAHAALGGGYTQRFFYVDADPQWERMAFVAIERALALDPNLAEAYLARGQLAWSLPNGFPHEQAVKDLKAALAINPGLADAHRELGKIYMHIGLLDKSIEANTMALRLDPADRTAKRRLIGSYIYLRDCEKALQLIGSDNEVRSRADALSCLGRLDEAMQALASARDSNEASLLAVLLARAEKHDAARRQIARLKLEASNVAGLSDLHHAQYNLGASYALMGDVRQAVTWLKKASREGLPCYPLYERDPHLDSVRQDPEFADFIQQLRAQWERFRETL